MMDYLKEFVASGSPNGLADLFGIDILG